MTLTDALFPTLGDELTTQDASGTTAMAYNLAGQMTSLTDPDNNQTVWARDALGRVTAEQNPSGTETFSYDANSNLTKQIDFDGHERDFVFDDLNRETAEKWMSGGTAINTISTAYNADGQVTSSGDNYSDYAFGYNGQGDQTSVDNAGTPNAPHVVLNSVYNAQGERTSLTATLNGTADFINNYSYDALSRLRNITQQGQSGGNAVAPKSIYIGLDGVGDITELDYSNSITQGQNHSGPGYATLTYSATTGLLTGINDIANGTSIDNLAYTYDPLARISTFTSVDGTATYGYDHTSQLVSATYTTASGGHQPSNISFTWDANGNNAAPGNVVSPNNEVTNDGTFTYTFDADGNRTSRTRISTSYASDHQTTYTWDYRNRLTDVEYFDNNGVLTKHVHYVYDTYDNLIEEDIDPNGGGTYTTKEQFALDVSAKVPSAGNAPLETFDASGDLVPSLPDEVLLQLVNAQLAERFLNGPSPSGADVVYAEGAVASLFQPDVPDWVFVNNQGSPTDTVDSGGNPIDHEVWSAFGQLTYESDPAVYHLQGFSGGIADSNTGLVKDGERWYDPLATVWISVDPAGIRAGDVNPERYVGNGAAGLVDPSGLIEATIEPRDPKGMPWYKWDSPNDNQPGNTFMMIETSRLAPVRSNGCYSNRFLISVKLNIGIDPSKRGKLTIKGVYGHEQKHVENIIAMVQKAKGELAEFEKQEFCSAAEATAAGDDFLDDIRKALRDNVKDELEHKGPNSPKDGRGAAPIDFVFPSKPKGTISTGANGEVVIENDVPRGAM